MSQFSDFWKKTMHKTSAPDRIRQIDFRVAEIVTEMQSVVDPTKWRYLLDEKEALDNERRELSGHVGAIQ